MSAADMGPALSRVISRSTAPLRMSTWRGARCGCDAWWCGVHEYVRKGVCKGQRGSEVHSSAFFANLKTSSQGRTARMLNLHSTGQLIPLAAPTCLLSTAAATAATAGRRWRTLGQLRAATHSPTPCRMSAGAMDV